MPIPPRWRLFDESSGATLTDCIEIDGLFTDRVFPAEPLYERYTLVSCTPSGALRAAIDGTGPDWLGTVIVDGVHDPCPPVCRECAYTMEELLDVRVVGHRPAADGSGLVDVELDGHRHDDENNQNGTVAPAVTGYRLHSGDAPVGGCRDIVGLFHERPAVWPPGPPVTLRGCRPGLSGLIRAELAHVRVDGTVHEMSWEHRVFGTVLSTRPSTLGDGLVDVELDARIPEPLAAGDRPIFDMWRAGGPAERNRWAALGRGDRRLWINAAAMHRIRTPDKPAGTVYHLDGRHITDVDAFYCALGEAINGPGGSFGGDLFWLHENAATGDGGATPGFRLIWHDAEVARTHLVPGYDRMTLRPAVTFDDLVGYLRHEGVQLELR
ncbi:hypothetical protein GCM10010168_75970 [Actinoplanes ianthinogenes]|uniref:Barstar (barnase inhibitor) domain-containing protein n=1 Tax=Actinoplanes ianthinogenes TaxID=122358 RepID=A0ABM7M9Y0_9ACTN|nr:barstar family protein [Actinoplanes ianthinogenes]BCJ48477.1 hypothetical protein Aiant_91340 [Actinoplanes ianthinogenes]GGR46071.1 hypothetical protein GCM10010168_75970 [Actinoplanes ianthinogenes]